MRLRSYILWAMLLLAAFVLAGCGESNDDTNTLYTTDGGDPYTTDGGTPTVFASFNLASMPLPNDVVWMLNDGDPGVDFTLSTTDPAQFTDMDKLMYKINSMGLDATAPLLGLSPNMFLTMPITGAADLTTLELFIFNTGNDPNFLPFMGAMAQYSAAMALGDPDSTAAGFFSAAIGYMAAMETYTQEDFLVVDGGSVIKLLPKKPFTPGGAYVVVAKSTLMDLEGYPVAPGFGMEALKSTEPFGPSHPYAKFESLRSAFNDGPTALFNVLNATTAAAPYAGVLPEGLAWTRDDVLSMWTFNVADKTLSLTPTAAAPADIVTYPGVEGTDFYDTLAYFKGAVSGPFPAVINNVQWKDDAGTYTATPYAFDPVIEGGGAPVGSLLSVYKGKFESPSITDPGNTDSVYFVLTVPMGPLPPGGHPVALYQHGLSSVKETVYGIANTFASVGFATLAIDAPLHGERNAPGASGDGFFSLNLILSRANLYQSAIDLWETVDLLNDISAPFDDAVPLDESNVNFSAISLGAIIGTTFLSREDRINLMHLAVPSAHLTNLLDESAIPSLEALVGSVGYAKGSTSYYVFLNLSQWLLDPVDPTYTGIGNNPVEKLMTVIAYDDPLVSDDCAMLLLSNLGVDLATVTPVDLDDTSAAIPVAGDYHYGGEGRPVIHSFLMTPFFDPAEPWYAGYSNADQISAYAAAQAQAAGFFASSILPPPPSGAAL